MKEIIKTTIGLYLSTACVLAVLKMAGMVHISWIWAFIIPVIVCASLHIAIFAMTVIFFIVGMLIRRKSKKTDGDERM